MSNRTHFHVSHNIPGYLPESDTLTALDVREALAILADELDRSADSIHESGSIAEEHDEDRARFYTEADRIGGMVDVLRWASDNPTDRFDLESDGDAILIEDVETGGLSVGIDHMPDSAHSLGLNFHLTVCTEDECADELTEDEDYAYRLLAETITTDDDGETVEGSHGIMNADGDYVPMDGIVGEPAAGLLDAHTIETDYAGLSDVLSEYGPADSINVEDENTAIVYLADLPNADNDVPYVSAIWVRGLGAIELAEDGSSSLAFLACALMALVPVSLLVVFLSSLSGALAGVAA